eukprot:TRINITY_DN11229_c1_g1_i1.p1 TRINITY_DN11229_c1_g1~~TRINITY_DN11229_c1_g1_i1.p1  ORF type:complete len:324 (-),score=33.31 TRINITY_DN11229_c1_g1_i1:206-1177(-)
MERPWVDKYRPKKVTEVSHQQEVVGALKHTVETGQFANLLFFGPPGTGKTSAALALCRQLYKSHYSELVIELNASDDRGIDVVRNKIKSLSSYVVKQSLDCPPFKIIILDEADQMTVDAQNALRRMMEVNSNNTRFILICNYVSKIIPALVSRCAVYRFQALPQEAIREYIQRVCSSEGVQIGDKAMEVLNEVSQGDLRKATNVLQSAVRLRGKLGIDPQVLYDVTGWIPQDVMDTVFTTCQNGNFQQVKELCYALIGKAYSTNQVLVQLREEIPKRGLPDKVLADACIHMGQVKMRLQDGASQSIQLVDLLIQISQILHKSV